MRFLHLATWILPGCVFVVVGLSPMSRALARGEPPVRNLGADWAVVEGDWLIYSQRETFRREDLNGDGDIRDSVVHVHNLATGETTNVRLAAELRPVSGKLVVISGEWMVLAVSEWEQDEDLSGDRDRWDDVIHVYNLSTGETRNLGFEWYNPFPLVHSEDWLALTVREDLRVEDLNGDGDTDDAVVHVHYLSTGETTNLGLTAPPDYFSGDWLVTNVYESRQGEDLNGDGDTEDPVVHVHNLVTGETANLRLAGFPVVFSGGWVALWVSESAQGEDLNGDGDTEDRVVHVHNLVSGETANLRLAVDHPRRVEWENYLLFFVSESRQGEDLNGDGDTEDRVVHVHNLVTGETANLRLAGELIVLGDWVALSVSESAQNEDLNGDGDRLDEILHVHDLSTGETRNDEVSISVRQRYLASENWLVFSEAGRVLAHNLATGVTTRLALFPLVTDCDPDFSDVAFFWIGLSGDWLVVPSSESAQGEDLNGDGDTEDWVVHVHDLARGETRNLRLTAVPRWGIHPPRGCEYITGLLGHTLSGELLLFRVSEHSQGEDLNGDGDTEDSVAHVHNLATGETTNLRLAGEAHDVLGDDLLFWVTEFEQGEDLNGDGDTEDWVVHVHDTETGETTNIGLVAEFASRSGDWLLLNVSESGQREDLNGDSDTEDRVAYVHNLATGETTNLGLVAESASLSGDWLVLNVSESKQGEDLNGDRRADEEVAHLVNMPAAVARPLFRRGDCNDDGTVDISDAVSTLGSLFLGEGDPGCDDACDSNDDGTVDISDAIATLGVLFLGNGEIPLPGRTECGVDPSEDEIGCESLSRCP